MENYQLGLRGGPLVTKDSDVLKTYKKLNIFTLVCHSEYVKT